MEHKAFELEIKTLNKQIENILDTHRKTISLLEKEVKKEKVGFFRRLWDFIKCLMK